MKLFVLIFIVVSPLANTRMKPNANTLVLKGTKELALKIGSNETHPIIQPFESNGRVLLAVENLLVNRSIDIHDYTTEKLVRSVKIPNRIRFAPRGFYVFSIDSILLLDNIRQRIFLINGDGELLFQVDPYGDVGELNRSGKAYASLNITSMSQAFAIGKEVYIPTYVPEKGLTKVGARMNLVTHQVDFPFSNLPNKYKRGWWSTYLYRFYYHDYNPGKKITVQSFATDHNLYTINNSGTITTHQAKSMYLPQSLKPYREEVGDLTKDSQALYDFERRQGAYMTIRYDPWQSVYYRVVIKPGTKPSQTLRNPQPEYSIIVLDENFKTLGEFNVPQVYNISQLFITKEGLHIARRNTGEATYTFGIFRVSTKIQN